MKLEVVVIPVSDVNRAKSFYSDLGWRLDADFAAGDDWRVIQFTPPGPRRGHLRQERDRGGSWLRPGTVPRRLRHQGRPRRAALGRGVGISEVFHVAGDVHVGADEPYLFGRLQVSGPDPDHGSYRSYASFSDPDGNGWLARGHGAIAWTRGRGPHDIYLFDRARGHARWAAPRTASTRSGPASTMRTGRTGTPSTSSGSRPARSCLS